MINIKEFNPSLLKQATSHTKTSVFIILDS